MKRTLISVLLCVSCIVFTSYMAAAQYSVQRDIQGSWVASRTYIDARPAALTRHEYEFFANNAFLYREYKGSSVEMYAGTFTVDGTTLVLTTNKRGVKDIPPKTVTYQVHFESKNAMEMESRSADGRSVIAVRYTREK